MSRHLLLAALALGFATASATDITEINGLTLTNGLGSISDPSALGTVNQNLAIATLTDSDLSTGIVNIGSSSLLPLVGSFSGPISSLATSVFFIQPFIGGQNPTGPFTLQLILTGGNLTEGLEYVAEDYTATTQAIPVSQAYFINAGSGEIYETEEQLANIGLTSDSLYGYLQVPFSDFGVDYTQVTGVRLSSLGAPFPDFTYIGLGYGGAPIPEPSTYGLILGGLALAGAAMRRKKISK